MLEQNSIRKEKVDKNFIELDAGKSEKYEIEAIWDNAVYAEELELGQLSGFYYLVAWKDYPKEKNIWRPVLAI